MQVWAFTITGIALIASLGLSGCSGSSSGNQSNQNPNAMETQDIEPIPQSAPQVVTENSLSLIDDGALRLLTAQGLEELVATVQSGISPYPKGLFDTEPLNPKVAIPNTDTFSVELENSTHKPSGFSIVDNDSNAKISQWQFSSVELAQLIVGANIIESNSGTHLVLLSYGSTAQLGDGSVLLQKPSLATPNQDRPVNITWVNIDNKEAPTETKRLSLLQGSPVHHIWQDHVLYLIQSEQAWIKELGTIEPDDISIPPALLDQFLASWTPKNASLDHTQTTVSGKACYSDQSSTTSIYHIISIDLEAQSNIENLCIHGDINKMSFDNDKRHLSLYGTSGKHIIELDDPISYLGSE